MATSHHSIIASAIETPDPDETPVAAEASETETAAEETESAESTESEETEEAEEAEEPSEAEAEPEEAEEETEDEAEADESDEDKKGEETEEAEEETEDESDEDLDRPVTPEEVEAVGKTRRMSQERFQKIYPFYNKAKEHRIESPEQIDELVNTYQDYAAIEGALLSGDAGQTARVLNFLGHIDGQGTAVKSIVDTLPDYLLANYKDGYKSLARPFFQRLVAGLRREVGKYTDEDSKKGMESVAKIVEDYLGNFDLLQAPEPKDPQAKAEREEINRERGQRHAELVEETGAIIDEKMFALVDKGLEDLTSNEHFPQKDKTKVQKHYMNLVQTTMQEDKLGMARVRRLRQRFEANPNKENRKAYVSAYVSMGLAAVKATQGEYLTANTRKIVQANNDRVEAAKRSAKKRSVAPSVKKPASVKLPAKKAPALSARDVLLGIDD